MSVVIPIKQVKPKTRLRYSTLEVLNTCERKFQLDNLLEDTEIKDESEHLSFGTGYGVGIAHYLVHQDPERAIYEAWLAYWPEIESDKKNVALMIAGLQSSFSKCDDLLQEYEVLYVNGKPATELTFRLDIDDEYYFTGAIDVVLRNKFTGICYVMDCKTTGLQLLDVSPVYANSGQTLGYSVALDTLMGAHQSSYGVLYFVLQMGKTPGNNKVHVLPFDKTILDRLNWFITLKMDVERIKQMEAVGVYPQRGGACLHYMRPCKYFGLCGLSSLGGEKRREVEEITEFDLTFDLDKIIEEHIDRVQNPEGVTIL